MSILSILSFCSSDPCSSPEIGLPPHEGINKKPSFLACSWRMRRKKKMKKQERRHHHHHHHNPEPIIADSISMDLTLQEWFAKSPSIENKRILSNNNDGGGSKVNSSVSFSRQFSSLEELLNSSEFQSSSMDTEESGSYSADSSRRDLSLPLEKLLMMREKKKVEIEVGIYSFAKTKSMSRERKVSFRLPEASDIIILNSPER